MWLLGGARGAAGACGLAGMCASQKCRCSGCGSQSRGAWWGSRGGQGAGVCGQKRCWQAWRRGLDRQWLARRRWGAWGGVGDGPVMGWARCARRWARSQVHLVLWPATAPGRWPTLELAGASTVGAVIRRVEALGVAVGVWSPHLVPWCPAQQEKEPARREGVTNGSRSRGVTTDPRFGRREAWSWASVAQWWALRWALLQAQL